MPIMCIQSYRAMAARVDLGRAVELIWINPSCDTSRSFAAFGQGEGGLQPKGQDETICSDHIDLDLYSGRFGR